MTRALVIDSKNQKLNELNEFLQRNRYQIRSVDSWENAIKLMRASRFDVIISALEIPKIPAARLTEIPVDTLLIFLSNNSNTYRIPKFRIEWLPEAASPQTVKSVIEKALLLNKLKQENECLKKQNRELHPLAPSMVSDHVKIQTWEPIIEHLPAAVAVMDSNRSFILTNHQFETLCGYSRAEILGGLRADSLFKNNSLAKCLDGQVCSNASHSHTIPMLHKDRKEISIQLSHQHLPQTNLHVLMLQLPALEKKVLTQKNNQLEVINTLILKINHLQNLNDVLRVTSKELINLLTADVCFIHLWERQKGSLRLAWLGGEPDKQKLQVDYLKKNNIEWWQFIKKRRALFIDQGQQNIPTHPLDSSKFASVWYLPLSYKRKLLGLITLGFLNACQLSDELKRLLNLISFQIGMTIENIHLKQEQTRRSQEIQVKNEELRSFIYTISHDLKSPLVALYGFADLLNENYASALDGNGQDYLNRILMNSELMHKMIDDLLELSRIGRVLGPRTKFSSRRLLEELAAIYEYQIQKKNIKLIYPDKMPIIYADRERIATVFQNLITNSIKYSRKQATPEIHIDWVEQKNDYLFCFVDNGIGISEQNTNRIFDLFQKFGDAAHDGGTGVGLTIVKKILEHHGGKIWVESEENVGTTFYFTIPKYSQVEK